LSELVHPPPPPMPGRYRVDLGATARMVDGPERELGRADTFPAVTRHKGVCPTPVRGATPLASH
jgi:hypothetical protein